MRLIDADAMLQNENEAYNKSLVKTEGTELALPNLIAHLKINKLIEETPTETVPENKALTLEELRQMDGEPVWIVMIGEAKPPICEIVVESYKDGLKMANVEGPDDYGAFDLYGKTWLAYARKPEGSKRP